MYISVETLIFLIIASILILFISTSYIKREIFDPHGRRSARATARTLSSFAMFRGFKVLSNVNFKDQNGETVVIENMLIGYFGILLVQTLGARGLYYGTLDSKSWSLGVGNKKAAFENPIKQLERQESALRELFVRKKIYNIPITHIVYISNASSRTAVYIAHNGEILLRGKLSAYIRKNKFEKDLGVDINQVVNSVLSD